MLHQAKQFVGISYLMSAYAAMASTGKVGKRHRKERLEFFTKNVSKYTKRALKLFHFEVVPVGFNPELMAKKNFLMVSNHLSYLDIMVLSSVQPCVFVTSVDMGETPFLGPMAEMGGSIFVERRNRSHIGRDIGMMADTLREGFNVVLYPEGTSGDGSGVLNFKRTLLKAAIEAGVDIMPIVVKYTDIDGKPFSLENRDKVCWYGDRGFFDHFMGVMDIKHVRVELHFCEPITVTPESDRHELAERAHAEVSRIYGRPFGTTAAPAGETSH